MTKKPVKFGSRKRYAEGGSTDPSQARYGRKVADIESDYQKALRRAGDTGRASEVAKAKYEQRMADAKDDLAKWTGADRTQTRAGEAAAERNLTMTRRYGAPRIAALDTPAIKPNLNVDLSGIANPSRALTDAGSFSDAFRAGRKAALAGGDKTFTWRGKTYGTDLAGEAPRRAAADKRVPPAADKRVPPAAAKPAAPAAAKPAAPAAAKPAAPAAAKPAAPAAAKPAAPAAPAADKPAAPLTASQRYLKYAADREAEAARERAAEKGPTGQGGAAFARLKNLVGFGSDAATRQAKMYRRMAAQEDSRNAAIARQKAQDAAEDKAAKAAMAKRHADIIAAGERPGASGYEKSRAKFYRENPEAMRKGGAVKKSAPKKVAEKKYAKGGSIDGCAVRGMTKAKRTR